MKRRRRSYFLIPAALCFCIGLSISWVNKALSQSSPTPTTSSGSSPTSPPRSIYVARLRPLNYSGVGGDVQIVLDDGTVGVAERVFGLAPGISHQQYVDAGTLCPDAAADTNLDGYIDALEAENYTGLPGAALAFPDSSFPIASESGNTAFIQSFSAATFFASLSAPPSTTMSPSPSPMPINSVSPSPVPLPVSSASPTPSALPSVTASATMSLSKQNGVFSKYIPQYNENTTPSLEGQVVVIDGVDPSTNLPDSVQGTDGFTAQTTLPVACGRLRQMLQ